VTGGPAYEPIDRVRRITNLSTGELGARLATAFQEAGRQVTCLMGELATYSAGPSDYDLRRFNTNEDLAGQLEELAAKLEVSALFHTAALCDYRVAEVRNEDGTSVAAGKIPSRGGRLHLELIPARKVIADLRGWFPRARIVGWKYELDGNRDEALHRGKRLLEENRLDACVVNGAAFGEGFGFTTTAGLVEVLSSREELCRYLVGWEKGR